MESLVWEDRMERSMVGSKQRVFYCEVSHPESS